MFRIWVKIMKDNRLQRDLVVCNEDQSLNRTKKVFACLEDACYQLDLSKPIWLDTNISEFQRHDKTRFFSDSFIEPIDFDYMEFHIIEED